MTNRHDDIVLVHSSDLHVDDDPHEPTYGDDGTTGLRVVLEAAKSHDAHFVLLVGDVFDNNRQSNAILVRSAGLLADAGRPVLILPGNHDPVTPDSVYLRGGFGDIPHVHIIGVTHDQAVHFPDHDLEFWGHPHLDYSNMVPLRSPRPRTSRWQIVLAHGHYEPDGVTPLRPSWLISDQEIEATAADYIALGHWNRAAEVGPGTVPAFYSGSPDLAKTVNVVRLTGNGTVKVTREPVSW
ncbi:MAG: exonuclease SbcCD subunit D [Acetobacteraceae bacterium]